MRTLKNYVIAGFFFTAIVGTLAHFIYAWSGNNPLVGLFVPVNESTWEHMKLLYFPMLLFGFYMVARLKEENPCINYATLKGISIGTLLIPIIFYSYTGILGSHTLLLDILTFYLCLAAAFWILYHTASTCKQPNSKSQWLIIVVLLGVCFLLFTYLPPNLGIFAEPATP